MGSSGWGRRGGSPARWRNSPTRPHSPDRRRRARSSSRGRADDRHREELHRYGRPPMRRSPSPRGRRRSRSPPRVPAPGPFPGGPRAPMFMMPPPMRRSPSPARSSRHQHRPHSPPRFLDPPMARGRSPPRGLPPPAAPSGLLPPGFRSGSPPRYLWAEAATSLHGGAAPQSARGPPPGHRLLDPMRGRSPPHQPSLGSMMAPAGGSGSGGKKGRRGMRDPHDPNLIPIGPPRPQRNSPPHNAPLRVTIRGDSPRRGRGRSRSPGPLLPPPFFLDPMPPPGRGRSALPPPGGHMFPPGFRGRSPSPPWHRGAVGDFHPPPGFRGPLGRGPSPPRHHGSPFRRSLSPRRRSPLRRGRPESPRQNAPLFLRGPMAPVGGARDPGGDRKRLRSAVERQTLRRSPERGGRDREDTARGRREDSNKRQRGGEGETGVAAPLQKDQRGGNGDKQRQQGEGRAEGSKQQRAAEVSNPQAQQRHEGKDKGAAAEDLAYQGSTPEEMRGLRVMKLSSEELRALVTDVRRVCWYYADPQDQIQGPHSMAQLQKWMEFLSTSTDPEHEQACNEFRNVSVYKKGMAMQVPLAELLASLKE